jgi:hypothetical protein
MRGKGKRRRREAVEKKRSRVTADQDKVWRWARMLIPEGSVRTKAREICTQLVNV